MTPYYDQDGIVIYHGDCLDVLPSLEGVRAIVADPPYGIGFDTDYTRFSGDRSNRYEPVIGDDSPFDPSPFLDFDEVILWGANCFSSRLPLGSWLIWDKRFENGKAWLSDAEVAWKKGGHGCYIFSKVWQGCVRDENIQHPTQKSTVLMAWCIREHCKEKGTILDPFMGSGTTLRAAKDEGRKAIGIEIEERYCEIAANRLAQGVLPFGERTWNTHRGRG